MKHFSQTLDDDVPALKTGHWKPPKQTNQLWGEGGGGGGPLDQLFLRRGERDYADFVFIVCREGGGRIGEGQKHFPKEKRFGREEKKESQGYCHRPSLLLLLLFFLLHFWDFRTHERTKEGDGDEGGHCLFGGKRERFTNVESVSKMRKKFQM